MYRKKRRSPKTIGCFLPPNLKSCDPHPKKANPMRPTERARRNAQQNTNHNTTPSPSHLARSRKHAASTMPASHKPTPADAWRFNGTVLTPQLAHLQAYTVALLNQQLPDPLLTFRFRHGVLTFHKSYLTKASPALRALVSAPFVEASSNVVTLHYESYHAFRVIRDFLYLTPIHMTQAPLDLPLVADRWGLDQLFHAYLSFVQSYHWPSVNHFMNACLPLLQLPRLPSLFKRSVVINFANNLQSVQSWIRQSHSERKTYNLQTLLSVPARTRHCGSSTSADAGRPIPQRPNRVTSDHGTAPLTTPEQNRFRESVLWQALHKQRIIPTFINYVQICHNNTSFNYLAFITHGIYNVLNGLLTEKEVAKIMSRAVPCHVPRLLSTCDKEASVRILSQRLLCAKSLPILPIYITVLRDFEIGQGLMGVPMQQALNFRFVKFCALLSPTKSVCDGSEEDVPKRISSSDFGD